MKPRILSSFFFLKKGPLSNETHQCPIRNPLTSPFRAHLKNRICMPSRARFARINRRTMTSSTGALPSPRTSNSELRLANLQFRRGLVTQLRAMFDYRSDEIYISPPRCQSALDFKSELARARSRYSGAKVTKQNLPAGELSRSVFIRSKGFPKVVRERVMAKGVEKAVILLGMQIRHVPRGIVRGFISLDEGLVLNIRFRNTFLSLIKLRLYTWPDICAHHAGF